MLRFVKESILTADLDNAGKTIVPLVVLAINLLLCRGKIRCLNDVIVWLRKEPMEPKGTIVPLTQWLKGKMHLPFLFQEKEAHLQLTARKHGQILNAGRICWNGFVEVVQPFQRGSSICHLLSFHS